MDDQDKTINRLLALSLSLSIIGIVLSVHALGASAAIPGVTGSGKATINKKTGAASLAVKVANNSSPLVRVNHLTIRTKNIRFNSKSWKKTRVTADDVHSYEGIGELNLPASAKVGSGRFDGVVQSPNDTIHVGGDLTLYNASLNQLVVEMTTTAPIANVHVYTMAKIYSDGRIVVEVPTVQSLPPILRQFVMTDETDNSAQVILTSLKASLGSKTITSTKKVHGKKTKVYKSFLTAKNKKNRGSASVNAL